LNLKKFIKNTNTGDEKLTKVELRPKESQQQLFRRFRKKVAKSGKLRAVRKKRWFVSKSEVRRIAKKKAIRKQKRRQQNKNRGPRY
jgi:small subunit ribosomal protein S21